MQIEARTVAMMIAEATAVTQQGVESLLARDAAFRPGCGRPEVARPLFLDVADISAVGREASAALPPGEACAQPAVTVDPNLSLWMSLVEAVTGRQVLLAKPDDFSANGGSAERVAAAFTASLKVAARDRVGLGVEHELQASVPDAGAPALEITGIVKTADGAKIPIRLKLEMSREFAPHRGVSLLFSGAEPGDPLVMHLRGKFAELSDSTFAVDLKTDGSLEPVRELRPGSAFLLSGRDLNGRPTNGSELFGPRTGDGFAELREQDADGTAWTDEEDPAYHFLRLLSRDEAGEEEAVEGPANVTGGSLTERGVAGMIQHIDLAL